MQTLLVLNFYLNNDYLKSDIKNYFKYNSNTQIEIDQKHKVVKWARVFPTWSTPHSSAAHICMHTPQRGPVLVL